jgi:DNA polymerase-4
VTRCIVHADLDAFSASVEQRDDPALRGRPVVVGGSPEQRGVVAAASYEARRYGIHSAMAMSRALRLCPEAVRVPPRFAAYGEVSTVVMGLYRSLTPLVEPLSLDEAYMDLTERIPAPEAARALGEQIKQMVWDAVGLRVSVGVAGSKSVAKIASDLEKPDGLVVVAPGDERVFLSPLPVSRLWGVGPRGAEHLRRLGVGTIGELVSIDVRLLTSIFGKWGVLLHDLANGVDARPVEPARETKSVARETTFSADVDTRAVLEETLRELAGGVAERLQRHGLRGRTITLKLRLSDFTTLSRQTTLPIPTDAADRITATAIALLQSELLPRRRFRLAGVAVSGFQATPQLALPLVDAPASSEFRVPTPESSGLSPESSGLSPQ